MWPSVGGWGWIQWTEKQYRVRNKQKQLRIQEGVSGGLNPLYDLSIEKIFTMHYVPWIFHSSHWLISQLNHSDFTKSQLFWTWKIILKILGPPNPFPGGDWVSPHLTPSTYQSQCLDSKPLPLRISGYATEQKQLAHGEKAAVNNLSNVLPVIKIHFLQLETKGLPVILSCQCNMLLVICAILYIF